MSPMGYSIQKVTSSYPRSWAFEGSNDGTMWTIVARRNKMDDLSDTIVPGNFTIANPEECRNVRFVGLARHALIQKAESGFR